MMAFCMISTFLIGAFMYIRNMRILAKRKQYVRLAVLGICVVTLYLLMGIMIYNLLK